ncbi:hypothetical protein BRADO2548 [Bradyrhizobium sp. ORS 278]|nr:hypothetical protein BRADO2548 [Bradyrhizobium sp. ORS 278]
MVGRPAPDLRHVCNGYANDRQPDFQLHKERALQALRMQKAGARRLLRRSPGWCRAIPLENSGNHGAVEALCPSLSVHQACGARAAAIDDGEAGRAAAPDSPVSAYRSSGR